jgi:hypothetical protein
MPMKAEYDAGITAAMRIIQADIDGNMLPQRTIFRDVSPIVIREFAQRIARAVIDAASDARHRIQQRDL